MKNVVRFLWIIALALATSASAHDAAWHPIVDGCEEQSVSASLNAWRDAPHSTSSLRFAVAPDTGGGPTIVVALDKGLNRALQADGEPVLIAAVGDMFRTCVHRAPVAACPAAEKARQDLLALQIPVSYAFDSGFILRLHATTFHLQWADGSGNGNSLAYTDEIHPISSTVKSAIDSLEQCWAPAMKMYQQAREQAAGSKPEPPKTGAELPR